MNSAPNSSGTGEFESWRVRMRPPMRGRASMMESRRPAWDRSRAAASPAAPAPRIRTSTRRRSEGMAQRALYFGIGHRARTKVPRGSQRHGSDVRAEGQHGDAALYQLANAHFRVGCAQLDDGHVERLVPDRFGPGAANSLLQLAAKEQIVALHQYALQPASFCVKYPTRLPAAMRSCLSVSRSRTVTV